MRARVGRDSRRVDGRQSVAFELLLRSGNVLQSMWGSQLQAAADSAARREAEMRADAINDEKCLAAADRAMAEG